MNIKDKLNDILDDILDDALKITSTPVDGAIHNLNIIPEEYIKKFLPHIFKETEKYCDLPMADAISIKIFKGVISNYIQEIQTKINQAMSRKLSSYDRAINLINSLENNCNDISKVKNEFNIFCHAINIRAFSLRLSIFNDKKDEICSLLKILENNVTVHEQNLVQGFIQSEKRRLLSEKDAFLTSCNEEKKLIIDTHECDLIETIKKAALDAFSEQFKKSIVQDGPVTIVHSYLEGQIPRSAEHVLACTSPDQNAQPVALQVDSIAPSRPEKTFRISNHGIGSGIYGLGVINDKKHGVKTAGYCFKAVIINNPLKVEDSIEGQDQDYTREIDLYTDVSKQLQQIVEDARKSLDTAPEKKVDGSQRLLFIENYLATDDGKNTISELAARFYRIKSVKNRITSQDHGVDHLKKLIEEALKKFLSATRDPSAKLVPQPINFLVYSLGFDGIAGTGGIDCFSKGQVKLAMNNGPTGFKPVLTFMYREDLSADSHKKTCPSGERALDEPRSPTP